MSILINDGKSGDEDVGRCDIGEFVVAVQKLKRQTAPMVKVVTTLLSIFRYYSYSFTYYKVGAVGTETLYYTNNPDQAVRPKCFGQLG